MLVSDKLVQAAFDWLQDNAELSAHAKASKIRAEHQVKRVKAQQFILASGTVAEREALAISSDEYKTAIDQEADSILLDETHRNKRNKSTAIIEAWRTEQSNYRAMGKVG